MDDLVSKISDLFIKYGIKNIVMDDIARELGISKKTLYNSFENKADERADTATIVRDSAASEKTQCQTKKRKHA